MWHKKECEGMWSELQNQKVPRISKSIQLFQHLQKMKNTYFTCNKKSIFPPSFLLSKFQLIYILYLY